MIQLQLETIAVCNAACVFCPYPTMKRKHGLMSPELFDKIINEAEKLHSISEVSFQGLGEPMLDPHILERIRDAKKKAPRWIATMYTNGSKLTVDNGMALEQAGLNTLYVSINASNAEDRKKVMKLDDFDQVVDTVRRLREKARFMKVVPKGVVGMDFFKGEAVEKFKQDWGDGHFLHLEGNWAGGTWNVRTVSDDACGRALGQIMVLWDGRISLCCFDGEGEVIFGDLNTHTLAECYTNPAWVRYRLAHTEGRRAELPLCANCTAI